MQTDQHVMPHWAHPGGQVDSYFLGADRAGIKNKKQKKS